MPEFPIPSTRILLVSQIQGGATALPAPLSGTPMLFPARNDYEKVVQSGTLIQRCLHESDSRSDALYNLGSGS